MNYTFTCGKCKVDFTIQGANLKNKSAIACPNCDKPVSDSTLSKLKSIETSFLDCKSLDDFGTDVKIEGTLKGNKIRVQK